MLLSKAACSVFRLYIYCQYMCSLGIEPTTFVLLTQCSTTEPQLMHQFWLFLNACVFQARCVRAFWLPVLCVLVRTEVFVTSLRIFRASLALVLLDGKVRVCVSLCITCSGGWWTFVEVGLWHTGTANNFSNNSSQNRQADLVSAPLPSVFLPEFSSQTDIGGEIVQSSVRVRSPPLSRNWKLRRYRTRPALILAGQKNRPFQLRFEDADWLNFMSHLEYI